MQAQWRLNICSVYIPYPASRFVVCSSDSLKLPTSKGSGVSELHQELCPGVCWVSYTTKSL